MPARRPVHPRTPRDPGFFGVDPDAQPLAARMRPRSLDEFVGQAHLVGPDGPFRRFIARGMLPSMVLWGPPGSGKTTLARLLADGVGAHLVTLSAVLAGVAEVRSVVAEAAGAQAFGGATGRRTVLFIDEIHRFNRAQQDALLPHVEAGTITLVGATTENAYLSVTAPLLSRLRVFRLEPLGEPEIDAVIATALADPRGCDGRVGLAPDVRDHLVEMAGGDARQALNLLEAAAVIAEAEDRRDEEGRASPAMADLEAAAQQRILAYDRAGDRHYDTISAFIKSIRGNDPDAALYWLATMIEAGEDPRFVARRLIIAASEDVGNADPRGLQLAVAAFQALEAVGLPEAQYALAQATVFLAASPKSNRAGQAYFAALDDVRRLGSLPVPLHLRNAPVAGMRRHGIGVGYRYPHAFEGADVAQQYLPDRLVGTRYYEPSERGAERQIGERLDRLRSARGGDPPGATGDDEPTAPSGPAQPTGQGSGRPARRGPVE